jgi:hypothetical protein
MQRLSLLRERSNFRFLDARGKLLVSADMAGYSALMAQARVMLRAIGDPIGGCPLQLE